MERLAVRDSASIAVAAGTSESVRAAEQLAGELGLPLVGLDDSAYAVRLVLTGTRLELRPAGQHSGPVYVDFVGGKTATRRRSAALSRDGLLRSLGRPRNAEWHVIDATAGLGRDAFLLAWSGCTVTMIERSAIMAALLEDGLQRAMREPELQSVVASRLQLAKGDAREILAGLTEEQRPDVVYIDPMFSRRAKSAASKKEMQLTRIVAGEDLDAAELLAVARRVARHRVVVKRWRLAPSLVPSPTIQLKGRTIRYDVYLNVPR